MKLYRVLLIAITALIVFSACGKKSSADKDATFLQNAEREIKLGDLSREQSNFEDAIEHYNSASAELRLMKSPSAEIQAKATSSTGECYAIIALYIWRDSRTITAEGAFHSILDIYRNGKDGVIKTIEGFMASPDDSIKEALKLLNSAVLQYDELEMAQEELNTYLWISLCMAIKGDTDQSVKYAARAKKIAENDIGDKVAKSADYETGVEVVYSILASDGLVTKRAYDGSLEDFNSLIENEAR